MDETPAILTSLGDALPAARNAVFAAVRPFDAAPAFGVPFHLRDEGVLFGGATLPAFGLFRDVPEAMRSAAAEQVMVLEHEGPDSFAVEILVERPHCRLVIARAPAPHATLAGTISPALDRAKKGPSTWSKLRGKARFTAGDVLKVPPLSVAVGEIRFRLEGGAGPVPEGEASMGRGEMYERYFVCDGPFIVMLLGATGEKDHVDLALWVHDASKLAAR